MEHIFEQIKRALKDPLKELEIEVDNIEYVNQNNMNFLRIYLDKINGIDLDSIVEATNIINPILDELDLIDETYILDVMSKERGSD